MANSAWSRKSMKSHCERLAVVPADIDGIVAVVVIGVGVDMTGTYVFGAQLLVADRVVSIGELGLFETVVAI